LQLFCAKYVSLFINLFKQRIAVTPHTRSKGTKGEQLAIKFLKKNGYKILQRNYRRRNGEIDVICYDHGSIVFVEVKTRYSDIFGPPELSVTEAKRRQIVKVASQYIANKKLEGIDLRFDVVSIFYPPDKKHAMIKLFKNAFTKNNTALSRK
jgi:putative endonuclease